jgi:DNA-binding NarL/FixJ family response regulator
MRRQPQPVDAALRERILTLRGHGMSASQIAREVGRPEGTIHSVVMYARKRGDPRARLWQTHELSARISEAVKNARAEAISAPRDTSSDVWLGHREGAASSAASCVSSLNCAPFPSGDGAALSPEEQTAVLSAFRRGASIHSIAVHHKCNRRTITRLLDKHGLRDCEQEDAKPRMKEDRRERRCLGRTYEGETCGRLFLSTWIGHRICPRCAGSVVFA